MVQYLIFVPIDPIRGSSHNRRNNSPIISKLLSLQDKKQKKMHLISHPHRLVQQPLIISHITNPDPHLVVKTKRIITTKIKIKEKYIFCT
jgi:hypothetical protein